MGTIKNRIRMLRKYKFQKIIIFLILLILTVLFGVFIKFIYAKINFLITKKINDNIDVELKEFISLFKYLTIPYFIITTIFFFVLLSSLKIRNNYKIHFIIIFIITEILLIVTEIVLFGFKSFNLFSYRNLLFLIISLIIPFLNKHLKIIEKD